MAAVGPYGIEQFDAPSTIANMQNMQFNRIRMMAAQKQLEMQDLMMNRQLGAMKALQAYAGSLAPQASPGASGSDSSASGASGSATTQPSAPAASAGPSVMPHANDVVAAPSGYDDSGAPTAAEMASRKQLLNSMAVLNPEMFGQLTDAFSKMDANQVAAVTARHTRMAQLAAGVLQLPQNQRAAAIQEMGPQLQALGLTPQQIQNFNPTDGNLRQMVAEGMDIERVAQFSRPDVVSVRQNGAAVSVNPDLTSTVNYETPNITGPNGEVYPRPLPTVQTPQDAMKLPPGSQFRLPDGRVGTVPGGAGGNASGGFQ